jgi:hypothetical protein
MADPVLGVYEQLVTRALERRLGQLDPTLVDRGPLDPVTLTKFSVGILGI